MTQTQFTAGSTGGANENFQYTTKGAAKLAASFHNGEERHFEVPLRHLCRFAKCKQIFPSEKILHNITQSQRIIFTLLTRLRCTSKRNFSTHRLHHRHAHCRVTA